MPRSTLTILEDSENPEEARKLICTKGWHFSHLQLAAELDLGSVQLVDQEVVTFLACLEFGGTNCATVRRIFASGSAGKRPAEVTSPASAIDAGFKTTKPVSANDSHRKPRPKHPLVYENTVR